MEFGLKWVTKNTYLEQAIANWIITTYDDSFQVKVGRPKVSFWKS